MKSFFEIASNMHPDDFKSQNINFPRFRGTSVPLSDDDDKFNRLRLGYDFYNVFSRYHDGEGDPLLNLLIRRGKSVDWVNVKASLEEIQRVKKIAGKILRTSKDEGEKRTAVSVLEEIRPYLSK